MGNPSPLRYPGGKYKLYKYVKHLIGLKKLDKSIYIEPFCGGAAVALNLIINNDVSEIIINDYDKSIYSFWYSVLNYTDELCNLIENTPITMKEWYKQKKIQENKEFEKTLELGFSTLFLNRTNRSGIIKAGVIGGMKQDGNYKMDCRFNKTAIIKKIRNIAKYSDRIKIYNLDAEEFINEVVKKLRKKSFIFFDPPYFAKGASLYTNFYNKENHVKLCEKIHTIKYHSWIVTYDNKKEISDIYKNYRSEIYKLNYSAQNKYKGEEVIFYSRTLSRTIKEKQYIKNFL